MKQNKHSLFAIAFVLLIASCGNPSSPPASPSPSDTPSTPVTEAPDTTGPAPHQETNSSSLGIDVSHFQNSVNWDEVKSAGITYAYSKATQGTSMIDPKYKNNRAGTIGAGLFHGAYHFYVAGADPIKQADNFINTVVKLEKNPMPPVLDLEQGGMTTGINIKQYQQDVLTWLKKVEQALGVRPVIYTNHPFGNQYLNNPEFASYKLWIAEYGVAAPKIPDTWKNQGWLMWQRTERGKVEGAIGDVDHDLLKGEPVSAGG